MNLIAFIILVASSLQTHHPGTRKVDVQDRLMVRLAYRSTHVKAFSLEPAPPICFSLYRSGRYAMVRQKEGSTEALKGILSHDELAAFASMLDKLAAEKSDTGAAVQQEVESFTAELMHENKLQHSIWIDPDYKNPFPNAVATIVDWLLSFKASGASTLSARELRETAICPSLAKPPQPPDSAGAPVSSGLTLKAQDRSFHLPSKCSAY